MAGRGLLGPGITSLVGNLALPASTLLLAPILARGLGVEGRGESAAAFAVFTIMSMLASVGVPDALTYFIAKQLERHRRLGWWSLGLMVVPAALAIVIAHALAPWLSGGSEELEALITATSWLVLPAAAVGALRGAAAGRARWGRIALEKAVTGFLRIAIVFSLLAVGALTPTSVTWAMIGSLLAGAVAYIPLRRARIETPAHNARFESYLRYASAAWLGSVAGVLLARVDQALMPALAGPEELGYYAVAVNISDVPLIVVATIVGLMQTADAKSPDNARLAASSRITTLLALLTAFVLAVSMPAWLPWLFGPEFLDAIVPAAILLAAVVVQAPGSISGAAHSARGTPQGRAIGIAVACSANVILLFALVPQLGATGAALAMFGGLAVSSITSVVLLRAWHSVPVLPLLGFRWTDLAGIWATLRSLRRSREQ